MSNVSASDPDIQDKNQELLEAAKTGDEASVIRLLEAGANVRTLHLHLAALKGHENIVKIFIDHGIEVNSRGYKQRTHLIISANYGHLTTARLLLDSGADVELRASDGWTALMFAAARDFPDIVCELLVRGAQEDVTDNDGLTALQIAEKFSCIFSIDLSFSKKRKLSFVTLSRLLFDF